MRQPRLSFATITVVFGSCLFILVLWVSAYLEPDIRWLHFFQAWMYLATIWLVLYGNRWGYFIGVSAAAFWDYINLFVTTFLGSGLHWLSAWMSTGHLKRLDQVLAVPGWIGNFLVVAGCIWGYTQLPEKRHSDIVRLALAFTLTTAFFAACIAICQPRYLPLFRAIFHPHPPW